MATYEGADHFRERIEGVGDRRERLALEKFSTWATQLQKKNRCILESRDFPSKPSKEILHLGMMRKAKSQRKSIATVFIYYPSYKPHLTIHWTVVRKYAPEALSAIAAAVGKTVDTIQDKEKPGFPVEVISDKLLVALTEAYTLAADA